MSVLFKFRPPGPVAERFMKSDAFYKIIRGPVGSGKTGTAIALVFQYICEQRPDKDGVRQSIWYAVRNTYGQLQMTIRDWRRMIPAATGPFIKSFPPTHRMNFELPDGTRVEAELVFLAMERQEDEERIRGANATGLWFNEIQTLDSKAVYDQACVRTDRYPSFGWSKSARVIADANPWDDDHWLQDLDLKWQQGKLKGYEFFVQPPAVIFDKETNSWQVNMDGENYPRFRCAKILMDLQGKKDDWIRVNMANEIGTFVDGRPVHPDYNDATHGSRELLLPSPNYRVFVGQDYGLTPAAAFCQKQADGRWLVFDEIVTGHEKGARKGTVGVDVFAQLIKEKIAEYTCRPDLKGLEFLFRGDPAGGTKDMSERTYFQALAASGIVALPASSNDPTKRRGALERPLQRMIGGQPGIVFSPRCRVLRAALAGKFNYKRIAVAGTDRYRDEPDKNSYSHVVEALEYALMDAGENIASSPYKNGNNFPTRPVQPTATWNPFDS